MERIYLDHAATTPLRPEVLEAMDPFLGNSFGNPSSIHAYGQEAKAALDNARDIISSAIGCAPADIVFTSGGTEADNLAVVGIYAASALPKRKIVTTQIEHDAVLNTALYLERGGAEIIRLPVDSSGFVTPSQVSEALDERTILVSVMHANNEIGVIEPIAELAAVARERGVSFHTDAVQSFGQLPVDVDTLGVDLMSLSSHKIYGPKGCGALYVRPGATIDAMLHGGGQERERRSGTENVAAIVGFGEATRLMLVTRDRDAARMRDLRDWFIGELNCTIPGIELNGPAKERLPNNINVSISGVEGEAMLLNLDILGIAASSGSACASGSIEPSHVLIALGVPEDRVRGALRLTLGRTTTREELQLVLDALHSITDRLRAMAGHSLYTHNRLPGD